MGQSPDSSCCNTMEEGIPFLQGCGEFGKKSPIVQNYCTQPKKISPAQSILISVRAPVGDINLADQDYVIGRGLAGIVAKDIDRDFLYYSILQFKDQLSRVSQGSTFKAINRADLHNFNIKIFEYSLQKKIAKILSTCDGVIDKTESAIAKYQAIKQGMMHDLFTRGIDNTTGKLRPKQQDALGLYKQSELGWIPKEWEAKSIEDYTSLLKSGLSRLLSQQDIGIPVLISGNIQDGKLDFTDLKYWYVNDPQGANTNNYILNEGDILLCFINSIEQIGKLAIFEGFHKPCIYTTNLFRIKAKERFDSIFLYYLLSSEVVQNEIKLITKPAVNQASFTTKDFLKIPVPLVDETEQTDIREKIDSIENKIKTELSTLSKYQQIKQGLMQDLLTGKVDVTADKTEEDIV